MTLNNSIVTQNQLGKTNTNYTTIPNLTHGVEPNISSTVTTNANINTNDIPALTSTQESQVVVCAKSDIAPQLNKSGNLVERYRCRDLNSFKGNEDSIRLLKNHLKHQIFNPTMIFEGEPGSGKTSAALAFATAVNCLSPRDHGSPCTECESCRAAASNAHPDIHEINAASSNGVDSARELGELVKRKPIYNKIIIILDEWQMMTANALTALLTVFEKASKADSTVSPSDYIFIMPTTDVPHQHKAVLSRAERVVFQPLTKQQLIDLLREVCTKDGYRFEDDAIEAIYKHAKGKTRDALTLLQTVAVYSEFNISLNETNNYIANSDSSLAPELFKSIFTLSITNTTELIKRYAESSVLREQDFNDLSSLVLAASTKSTPFMQDVYTQCLKVIRDERINFLRDRSSRSEDNLIIACNTIISILRKNIAPAICDIISSTNHSFGELLLSLAPDIKINNGRLIFELAQPPTTGRDYLLSGLNNEFIISVFKHFGVSEYKFR